jgi:SAM-dependent methyltransferase
MLEIDRTQGRRAFGEDPEGYKGARPDYPSVLYEILETHCGLRPGTRTFEIGPGPGLATRHLLELGASPLTVIEPDPRLAEFLAGKLGAAFPQLDIQVGTFEEVTLPPSAFDLGACASAFHWIDESVGLRKAARMLVPGGWWAMWWNVFSDTAGDDPFHQATQPLLKVLERSPAQGSSIRPGFALDVDSRIAAMKSVDDFTDISYQIVERKIVYDSARLKALYATFSPISLLEPVERHMLLDQLELVAERDFGGRVERTILTPIYLAMRGAGRT